MIALTRIGRPSWRRSEPVAVRLPMLAHAIAKILAVRSRSAFVVALLTVAAATGCTGDESPPLEEETASAEDLKAVEELYLAYWDSVVQAEAELDADPSRFEAVMTPDAINDYVAFLQGMVDNNLFRDGEPVIDDVTVEIHRDYAIAQGCVDASRWLLGSRDGTRVRQILEPGPQPHAVAVRRQDDGSWLIDQTPYQSEEEATIKC